MEGGRLGFVNGAGAGAGCFSVSRRAGVSRFADLPVARSHVRGRRVVVQASVLEKLRTIQLSEIVPESREKLMQISVDGNKLNTIGLRAIADASVSSVIYELWTSLYCCSCFMTQVQLTFSSHFCQLFAGAVLGIWTIVSTLTTLMSREKHDEAKLQERIGMESKDVANEWMEYVNSVDGLLDVSPVVYENSKCELVDFEDVEYALTWLFWLNESEGSGTRLLLDKLTNHPSAELRLGLVRSLRELRLPSNGAISLLQRLRLDSDAEVAYEAQHVLSAAFGVELYEEQAAVPAKVERSEGSVDEARAMLSRILAKSSDLESAIGAVSSGGLHAFRSGLDNVERSSHPLRFMGEHELHTLGGLAAYPQSEEAFDKLKEWCESPIRKAGII